MQDGLCCLLGFDFIQVVVSVGSRLLSDWTFHCIRLIIGVGPKLKRDYYFVGPSIISVYWMGRSNVVTKHLVPNKKNLNFNRLCLPKLIFDIIHGILVLQIFSRGYSCDKIGINHYQSSQ